MTDLVAARQPFVDGRWIEGTGAAIEVEAPYSGDIVATVAAASPAEVETAILAARRAFDEGPWPTLPARERVALVRRLGEALEARRATLVDTVIEETGCPVG